MAKTGDAQLSFHTRSSWSKLRYRWMMQCLMAKFHQHQDRADLLVSTEDLFIVEEGRLDDDADGGGVALTDVDPIT